MNETIRYQGQQVRAARAAAMNIKHNLCDLQLFVLQPSNQLAAKNEALEATMRIDRLAKAIIAIDDDQLMTNHEMLTAMLDDLITGRSGIAAANRPGLLPKLIRACEILSHAGETQEAA